MKFNKIVALAFAAVLGFGAQTANAQSLSPSTKWHWDKGTMVVETPARPAGQKNVLGLKLPKYKTVRIGLVGLGMRGPGAVDNFCVLPGVEIVALCDFVEARAVAQNEKLRKRGLPLTSTSFTSQPTGHTTSPLLNALCKTARTLPTKCLLQ